MNDDDRRTAALRCIDRILTAQTTNDIRGHLGFDEGQAVADVEHITYFVRTAAAELEAPPADDDTIEGS